jgi:hypothetical protein
MKKPRSAGRFGAGIVLDSGTTRLHPREMAMIGAMPRSMIVIEIRVAGFTSLPLGEIASEDIQACKVGQVQSRTHGSGRFLNEKPNDTSTMRAGAVYDSFQSDALPRRAPWRSVKWYVTRARRELT